MHKHILPTLAGLALAASAALGQTPCGAFVSTPVPMDSAWWEAEFEDVTTLPDGTAWATGHYKTLAPGYQIETFTLAFFWDGQQWQHVPTPSPSPYPGGTEAYLHAVGAVAPDDVWAAGERRGDAGGLSVGAWIMVQHWDGSAWNLEPVPAPPGGVSINFSGTRVEDIVALAADDVWFGGQWGEPNAAGSVTWRPLAMHWNGSSLQIFDTPAPYEGAYGFKIVSMSAVSSGDIWAVCNRLTAGGHAQQFVVLHWNGSVWNLVDVPNSGGMRVLYTVEAVASDDVWIFGEDEWPSGPSDVFALHYDGTGWTETTGAPPARGAFATGAASIYAGAGYNIGHGVSLFDGQQWNIVESFPGLNVHVFEGERGNGCNGWIVGREMVGGKKPFAARLVPTGASAPFCFGDGSGAACPCANESPAGDSSGCLHSLGSGGRLVAAGFASLSADTLVLRGSQMPDSASLYIQGTAQQNGGLGIVFGDGLRCVGGSIVRLGTQLNVMGASQYPAAGDPPVSVRGLVTAPGERTYQCWYRNSASYCTPSTFNLTNGWAIAWTP
jgi:hypothetical protein